MNILITGARSGIAYKVIEKLKNTNYNIYVTVENNEQLKRVKEIYKNYKNITCLRLNILNEIDINKISYLEIDILISNAAIGNGGSIAEININKLKENFNVNVFGNFKLIQIVLKNMIKNNKGRIIIMSSLAGYIPINFLGSYCATKASINMLTRCLKNELKIINDNIKIVLILPGMYHTGFNQVMLENKYNDLKDGYFKEELELIRAKENILFNLFELKSYDSIVNKIYKAIIDENPKFIYTAPIYQYIFSKIYQLLK
ncbi:MAG: SDR family NAD(P)-dependent oxidoreductase [Firmicutes bacterium]|nr:SDR family NAD(P)-dependent oxidoreductase [Bacillota bacterium]